MGPEDWPDPSQPDSSLSFQLTLPPWAFLAQKFTSQPLAVFRPLIPGFVTGRCTLSPL